MNASGNYIVTITLHSYSNLQETCVECNPQDFYGCCDDSGRRATFGCEENYLRCDTQFHFCLLPVGSVSPQPPIQCSTSGPGIYSAVEQESSKTINFPLGEVLQINNPFVLRGNSNIWIVCMYVCEYNGDFEAESLLCALFNSY